ncbi:hypothetical protein Tco_0152971 [Tanacetum coccineum]
MLAITISWFLVSEEVEMFKNMVEHKTHFVPHLMDKRLSSLAMWTSVFLWLRNRGWSINPQGLINGNEGELGGVENRIAQGARGDALIDDLLDDISMKLVLVCFLGGFLVEEEALEAIFGGEQRKY